jgi:hypothetical protein
VDLALELRLLLLGSWCSYLKCSGRSLSKLSVAGEGVGLAKVFQDFEWIVVPSGDVVERIMEDGVILAKTDGDHAECKIMRKMSSCVSFLEGRGRKEFICSPPRSPQLAGSWAGLGVSSAKSPDQLSWELQLSIIQLG